MKRLILVEALVLNAEGVELEHKEHDFLTSQKEYSVPMKVLIDVDSIQSISPSPINPGYCDVGIGNNDVFAIKGTPWEIQKDFSEKLQNTKYFL